MEFKFPTVSASSLPQLFGARGCFLLPNKALMAVQITWDGVEKHARRLAGDESDRTQFIPLHFGSPGVHARITDSVTRHNLQESRRDWRGNGQSHAARQVEKTGQTHVLPRGPEAHPQLPGLRGSTCPIKIAPLAPFSSPEPHRPGRAENATRTLSKPRRRNGSKRPSP